jgi:ElaB/YqjD/DUF883 family membrane-anchored ribosome-binding protein
MAADNDILPEDTDAIITGAGIDEDTPAPRGESPLTPAVRAIGGEGVRDQLLGRYDALRGDAGDAARNFVQAGKDRAAQALDDVVQMIEDAAEEVDAKLGTQYGDYARRAAQGIGDFSDAFKDKDVDTMFADARAMIQKSPGMAVGIAAALGFVVARLARSGLSGPSASDAPTT